MKTKLVLSIIMLFMTGLVFSQNAVVQENIELDGEHLIIDKNWDSFVLDPFGAKYLIKEGTPYQQCKQVAELLTRKKTFNTELFAESLQKLDQNSVKDCFKNWGLILDSASRGFKIISMKEFEEFSAQTMAYGIIQGMITMNEARILKINNVSVLMIFTGFKSTAEWFYREPGNPSQTQTINLTNHQVGIKIVGDTFEINKPWF